MTTYINKTESLRIRWYKKQVTPQPCFPTAAPAVGATSLALQTWEQIWQQISQ